MEPKIKSATLLDLPEIRKLYTETIKSVCSKDYDERQILAWISTAKNDERWRTAVAEQYFLIAQNVGNQIVGFASLKGGNHIDFMFIDRNSLRKGVATRLFEELEKEAKRLGHTLLTSDVSKTAWSFFERRGFTVVHENHNMIENVGIVNYRMIKRLSNI